MNRVIGSGVVEVSQGSKVYRGTIPFKIGEPVVLVTNRDLGLIMRRELLALLSKPIDMPIELYDNSKPTAPLIPDEIIVGPPVARTNRLFLDRHFYSPQPEDYIITRWISVEAASQEEGIKLR